MTKYRIVLNEIGQKHCNGGNKAPMSHILARPLCFFEADSKRMAQEKFERRVMMVLGSSMIGYYTYEEVKYDIQDSEIP